MSRIEKTVFISYRRTNFYTALAVYQDLTQHGYDVFFDFQSIDSGDFEKTITENIKAKAHFLIILSPSALERCSEPGDWLRREIEMAMDEKRNIVPLMMEGFDFGSPSVKEALSGKLATLNRYNGLRLVADYFFEGMGKLRERYLNIALDDVLLHPLSTESTEITKSQKNSANEAALVETIQLTAEEWFERAFVLHEANNLDEAIRCYNEAIRLEPDNAMAYNNRGTVRTDKNDTEGAIIDFTEAIRLEPEHLFAHYNRGAARNDIDDFEGAILDLNIAIKLNPEDADAYYERGRARLAKGDIETAISDFDKVIRLNPNDSEAYYERGHASTRKGDLEDAIDDFNESIRLKPDDAEAYDARALVYSIRGDNLRALSDLQKAAKINPENGSIQSSLLRVLKSLGEGWSSQMTDYVLA